MRKSGEERRPACLSLGLSLSLFCGYREEGEEVGPGVGLAFERRTRIAAECEAFLYLLPFFHGCMDTDGRDVDVDGLHMEGKAVFLAAFVK